MSCPNVISKEIKHEFKMINDLGLSAPDLSEVEMLSAC